jgi:glycine cleavage system H protein
LNLLSLIYQERKMMSIMKYTEDHEWVRLEDDGTATVGITYYAQDTLGDIVYVELPEIGAHFVQGDAACVVESVKAAADVKMPVSGKVIALNDILPDQPELVNTSPEEEGWFIRIELDSAADLDSLMDESQYQEHIA